jgi:hypothetical protein
MPWRLSRGRVVRPDSPGEAAANAGGAGSTRKQEESESIQQGARTVLRRVWLVSLRVRQMLRRGVSLGRQTPRRQRRRSDNQQKDEVIV